MFSTTRKAVIDEKSKEACPLPFPKEERKWVVRQFIKQLPFNTPNQHDLQGVCSIPYEYIFNLAYTYPCNIETFHCDGALSNESFHAK